MGRSGIRLVLSDVDGTLLTSDKVLTAASIDAVRRLHDAGIAFTVTSSRPPQGMRMLFEPLAIDAPVGAFNGGVFVDTGLNVLDELPLPVDVAARVVEIVEAGGLAAWVYTASRWFVRDLDGPRVQLQAEHIRYEPTRTDDLVGVLGDGPDAPAKVVGVSNDHAAVAAAEAAVRHALGHAVSATRSQPVYLDVTHPGANKGAVVAYLSRALGIPPEEIATIGDGQNDTLMFAPAGTSIAMGNASDDVKAAATAVTTSNDEDGFARAVHEVVLAG